VAGKRAKPATRVARALRKCERDVMKLDGVSGVALTRVAGRPCIAVYVERASEDLRARIAREVDGVPVKIEVSGRFDALSRRG
jgi:hypothetical protein